MRLIKALISSLIFFFVCVPAMIMSFPVVALLLLTSWSGRTTIFGNAKWGRGNDHFAYPTKGWWQEFNWLVLRNPVNNLMSFHLSAPRGSYTVDGDINIGDKIKGGFYRVTMGVFWEYYWIKPYTVFGFRRCIRVRFGWKILGNDRFASFVWSVNPWKAYMGV